MSYGQQPYQPQYPPPGPPQRQRPRRSRGRTIAIAIGGAFAALVLIGIIGAIAGGGKTGTPAAAPVVAAATTPASPSPAQSTAAEAAPRITYVVTGTPGAADVTYGPEGSSLSGTVPMRVTKPLGSAGYYAVNAQLQGGGSVTVKILVGGTVVSSGTATGGYNIASAEISQNPLTGQWEDTQG